MKKMDNRTPLRVTFTFEIEPEQWGVGNQTVTHKVSMSGLMAERLLDVPASLTNKIAQMAVAELANISLIEAEVKPDAS